MRPNKDQKRITATKTPPSSPPRRRTQTTTTPSAFVLERELLTEEENATFFKDVQISSSDSSANPRSFPYSVKQQCWEKAEKVKGRDPDRWRRDALGNIVFRKLVGCPGCLCHDYDHILPYSKVLQFLCEYFWFDFREVVAWILHKQNELPLCCFWLLIKFTWKAKEFWDNICFIGCRKIWPEKLWIMY